MNTACLEQDRQCQHSDSKSASSHQAIAHHGVSFQRLVVYEVTRSVIIDVRLSLKDL